MNKIQFVSGGLFVSNGEWQHPKRIIDTHELIFVVDGTVCICEDGRKYYLKKNEVLHLSPGLQHFGFELRNEKISFFWIHFSGPCPLENPLISGCDTSSVCQMMKMLLHFNSTENYPNTSKNLMCELILNELVFLTSISDNPSLNPIVTQVKDWLRVNIKKNVTVADTANYFGYDACYLSKLFKKSCGINMKEYIDSERIKYAKTLLINTAFSIKQISFMLGFGEENLFLKFFKYHEKISPKAFRNTYFNIHTNNN